MLIRNYVSSFRAGESLTKPALSLQRSGRRKGEEVIRIFLNLEICAMKEILERLWAELGDVGLVAVSKTHSAEVIEQAYVAGQRTFGENRVQELVAKYEALPKDIEWHFIGHLQTNKVKYIVPFVELIQGVDSERLLEEIERQGERIGRRVKVLLEVHVAREETKSGWEVDKLMLYINGGKWRSFRWIEFCGLMTIASNTDDEAIVRGDFQRAQNIFERIRSEIPEFKILSMGMTGDYRIAIDCGSTMVRIGSAIFGQR